MNDLREPPPAEELIAIAEALDVLKARAAKMDAGCSPSSPARAMKARNLASAKTEPEPAGERLTA